MRNFFHKVVPLWIAILSLIMVATISALMFVTFSERIYDYQLNLPANGQSQITTYTYGGWPALTNTDFYNQVFNNLRAQKATFISANLSTMQLTLYQAGVAMKAVPILARGKPGSWWETPAGLYKVEEKIPKDFSSFAHVYSPWALDFQGNFLIHGWPYYPNGTPVGSTYSGGCIRLSTDDAKTLYDMVDIGTPVLVSSANFETDAFHEKTQGPSINPTSYLAADLKSNFVFAEKNPNDQVPIASLTKLITALVAVEYVNIEKKITITPDMIVKTSIPRLRVGQEYSLYDLLQPLLKESSNEAAVVISDLLGPRYFVNLMNSTAQSIGMKDTHFVDSSGSNWGNVSTARDLFLLAQYLYDNRSFILKMTTNNNAPNAYGSSAFVNLQNFNVFADNPNFIGGKVGMNGGAGDTILSIFKGQFIVDADTSTIAAASTTIDAMASSTMVGAAPSATRERPFMFVILGSSDYASDAQNLLTWIKNTYR